MRIRRSNANHPMKVERNIRANSTAVFVAAAKLVRMDI